MVDVPEMLNIAKRLREWAQQTRRDNDCSRLCDCKRRTLASWIRPLIDWKSQPPK